MLFNKEIYSKAPSAEMKTLLFILILILNPKKEVFYSRKLKWCGHRAFGPMSQMRRQVLRLDRVWVTTTSLSLLILSSNAFCNTFKDTSPFVVEHFQAIRRWINLNLTWDQMVIMWTFLREFWSSPTNAI